MLKIITQSFKDFKKDDEAKFRLKIGFVFSTIPFISITLGFLANLVLLKSTLVFLKTYRSDIDFIIDPLVTDYIIRGLKDALPMAIGSFFIVLVAGIYLGHLALRPFEEIENYCRKFLDSKGEGNPSYDVEFQSELRLMSGFSDWFFTTTATLRKAGKLTQIEVPAKYKKIHRPVFESMFFIHKSLYVLITCILSGLLIMEINYALFDGVVSVVNQVLVGSDNMKQYILGMSEIQDDIMIFTVLVNFFLYSFFLMYLYNKVATPAFGVFATMRSFISGRYTSRVHLIGYRYIRNKTRILNKYLDHMEKEYSSKVD